MKNEEIRLNPFVYISETDIRFYLLILSGIIMPLFWTPSLLLVSLYSVKDIEETIFLKLLSVVLIFCFIIFLIYRNYNKFPTKIIKNFELKEFDKNKFPDQWKDIEKLYANYFSTEKEPILMYQLKGSGFSFTFGTKNHLYVAMFGQMIVKYRENINRFKSIFLHEMAHIINKDVEKTYLAVSTWNALYLILFIPLAIFLFILLISFIIIGPSGFLESFLPRGLGIIVGLIFYFLFYLAIVYLLRNQVIRLREFYADAKVLELVKSPVELMKTLEEMSEEQYLKYEILSKFHPKINERIQFLKNNLNLFAPDMVVAFTIGFSYGLIENFISPLIIWIFLINMEQGGLLDIGIESLLSLLIVPILMLAVSSSFHKSILKDIFNDNIQYISISTIVKAIKFSMVFSIGYVTQLVIAFLPSMFRFTLIGIFFEAIIAWIMHALFFFIPLIFLLIFAPMLIKRSFSKKEADKKFLIITIISSFLYVIGRFATEILVRMNMLIIFFLIFSVITYALIKIKYIKLYCPNCSNKILISSKLQFNCPNCQHNLYPWAIYSF